MKAAVVAGPGATPQYTDFPEPPAGTELAELVAAGIHPATRALVSGRHYASAQDWPVVAGIDAVARTSTGALVYTGMLPPPYGTLAERFPLSPTFRCPVPDGADPVAIAGGANPGLASWLPLTERVGALGSTPLGTVVVLGATGSAGLLAIQNAKLLGADRVVAVGREPGRLGAAARLGAEPVALTGDQEADAATLAAALAGRSPSTILDFVWGAVAEVAFAALARRGASEDAGDIAHVQIGSSAGATAAVPAELLRGRHYRVYGSGAGSISMATLAAQLPRYLELLGSGGVRLTTRTAPLADVAAVWNTGSDARMVLLG